MRRRRTSPRRRIVRARREATPPMRRFIEGLGPLWQRLWRLLEPGIGEPDARSLERDVADYIFYTVDLAIDRYKQAAAEGTRLDVRLDNNQVTARLRKAPSPAIKRAS